MFNFRNQDLPAIHEILGYLNFSSGRPDSKFQRLVGEVLQAGGPVAPNELLAAFDLALNEAVTGVPALADSQQARAVLKLTLDQTFNAYREHHRDLLFHLTPEDFYHPFLYVRMFEAVLEQGGPWSDSERIVGAAVHRLNDFVGFRPVPVLENGRRAEVYAHERFRPVPLFIKGAGVAPGKYAAIVGRTLELLAQLPPEVLFEAHFDLAMLDELALDQRAHDHMHPANKRTNYLFGEWDPHQIDVKGQYRRFVLRQSIVDAFVGWLNLQKRGSKDEHLFDAAAVLTGTILMASSISGSGPETHDSTVSLTSLLPKVARQRDSYYLRLMETATGARLKRLQRHAKETQQPFGHVRQHLNMYLANYGTQQVQRRHLSYLFARLGYPEESQRQAAIIPAASARFEAEIQWRLTSIHGSLDNQKVFEAVTHLKETEDLLHRGIECGALVDPWNILGFQGFFPLFSSREDSVPDPRIEPLLGLMDAIFGSYAQTIEEASAQGLENVAQELLTNCEKLAVWWDRFATTAVSDLAEFVSGSESFESARHVAQTLSAWREAGEAAGDISFWRQHIAGFRSVKAYAQVVEALLDRKDVVASMGLLVQWLSEAEEVGLEAGPHSFYGLAVAWFDVALDVTDVEARWTQIRRFFDFVEANAGDLWSVPNFTQLGEMVFNDLAPPVPEGGFGEPGREGSSAEDFGFDVPNADADDEGEDDVFGAAYDDFVFRDSTADGFDGSIHDGSTGQHEPSELDIVERLLDHRLKFLRMLAQLWQMVATEFGMASATDAAPSLAALPVENLTSWLDSTKRLQHDLQALLSAIASQQLIEPSGDHDSNVEFDLQMQTKFHLLQMLITTLGSCQSAEWCLLSALPPEIAKPSINEGNKLIVAVYRGIVRRDVVEVRKLLPMLQRFLHKKPLLYVPLDHGGGPQQIMAARTMQAVIRFLLTHLPRLGLLRETWHILRSAHEMEHVSRPQGMAVTEFDRLFRIALRNSLEGAVDASASWKSGRFNDEELIEIVGSIVEHYLDQWLEHSSTMRLSSIENLKVDDIWENTQAFITKYGADLLHAQSLTLGNIRTILHQGVSGYLEYLEETEDPLTPIKLLEDIRTGGIDRAAAVETLELIYQMVVDRFDRFMEYNSTTTQSDYGQMFYTLLDFLRLEISYERDNWNLIPVTIAHEVLTQRNRPDAAEIWEEVFAVKTEEMADRHLLDLAKLEKTYGMRLPSISNHLSERFVKPLAVNKMRALMPILLEDSELGIGKSESFSDFVALVEEYLKSTSGSGLDVPAWLRNLEEELNEGPSSGSWTRGDAEPELNLPAPSLTLREMRQQLRTWWDPLAAKKKP